MLRIGPQFTEPVDDDIPTDLGEAHEDENDKKAEEDDIANVPLVYIGGEPILPDPGDA